MKKADMIDYRQADNARSRWKMRIAVLFTILFILSGFVPVKGQTEYKSTIDYIQKTGRLWGISKIKINKDNSVTLFDADSGHGHSLMLSLTEVVKSVTLNPGESCTLSDGHHAFIKYELRKCENGKATFMVTDRFDARSFGGGIKTETKIVTVPPHGEV